jgi:Ca2+-binding RTX toxin-like protein
MTILRLAALGMMIVALATAFTAGAASNTVNSPSAGAVFRSIGANDLKPAECAHLNLVSIVVGSGTVSVSGNLATLLIGGPGDDKLTSGAGDSCILGGAGNDQLFGGQGPDVLLGGLGDDRLNGGPGIDICYGGGGNDQYTNCETVVP